VKRWLSLPGDYAYSIYLVHWPILELTGHILRPWVKANPWSAEPVHILIVAATVAYAAFHYRWVERPLYRFATSWLKKPRPATLQAAPAV
jgi:peptidoglycan/LPS O-acetylase OafA/YrhL